jgi:hypothetical protein
MRTCLAISVVIHTVVMLWLMLAPSARTLEGMSVEPVLVELVAPQDAPRESEVPTVPQDSEEERAATAARLAWMLNLPTDTAASLAAPPSEDKAHLPRETIAQFKAQVGKCWVAPADAPSAPGFDVLIRIALNPDGRLGAKPELIRAPASLAGPALVDSAMRALQKCQPYGGLPADRYREWKILDLTFTADGPAGLSERATGKGAVSR